VHYNFWLVQAIDQNQLFSSFFKVSEWSTYIWNLDTLFKEHSELKKNLDSGFLRKVDLKNTQLSSAIDI